MIEGDGAGPEPAPAVHTMTIVAHPNSNGQARTDASPCAHELAPSRKSLAKNPLATRMTGLGHLKGPPEHALDVLLGRRCPTPQGRAHAAVVTTPAVLLERGGVVIFRARVHKILRTAPRGAGTTGMPWLHAMRFL